MKIQNLQIGDWAQFLIDIEDQKRVHDNSRIAAINRITGYVEAEDIACTAYAKDLLPIDITDEIMEKNFEATDAGYEYTDDFYDILISEYTEGLWEILIDELEFSSLPTWKMYVHHVHQLQQALRLAGIEKEIQLW